MQFVWFGVIGLIVGLVVGRFLAASPFGVLGDVVIGALGGLLGGFLFGYLGLVPESGRIGGMIFAGVGAVILIFLPRTIKIDD